LQSHTQLIAVLSFNEISTKYNITCYFLIDFEIFSVKISS